jgi:hypothetical protein
MNLRPGEVICDECNGVGDLGMTHSVYEYKSSGNTVKFPGKLEIKECTKCFGAGKLDWIEAVVGKKDKYPGAYVYAPYVPITVQNKL